MSDGVSAKRKTMSTWAVAIMLFLGLRICLSLFFAVEDMQLTIYHCNCYYHAIIFDYTTTLVHTAKCLLCWGCDHWMWLVVSVELQTAMNELSPRHLSQSPASQKEWEILDLRYSPTAAKRRQIFKWEPVFLIAITASAENHNRTICLVNC